MNREPGKIIQISYHNYNLYALTENGDIFYLEDGEDKWHEVPTLNSNNIEE